MGSVGSGAQDGNDDNDENSRGDDDIDDKNDGNVGDASNDGVPEHQLRRSIPKDFHCPISLKVMTPFLPRTETP